MLKKITIADHDIYHILKISGQIPVIVEQVLVRKIVESATVEAGITLTTEELQIATDQWRRENQLVSAQQTWQWLEDHELSVDDLEEFIQANLLGEKLANHLFTDKVEPYFFENQLDYATAVIYEIVLDDHDLALELFYIIQEEEMSFYDVAHQYIQDTELSRKCGYRGQVNRRELKPEVSAAVFAAQPPQLLKPIITSLGIHLILVVEIIQPELDEKLRQTITGHLFAQWLKEQIANMDVVRVNQ